MDKWSVILRGDGEEVVLAIGLCLLLTCWFGAQCWLSFPLMMIAGTLNMSGAGSAEVVRCRAPFAYPPTLDQIATWQDPAGWGPCSCHAMAVGVR